MSERLSIRLQKDELDQIKNLANSSGLPLSTYTKMMLISSLQNLKNDENFAMQMLINRELFRLAATSTHVLYQLLPADKRDEILEKAKQRAFTQTAKFFDGDIEENEQLMNE
ncbi:hypothetical protein [Sulfuriferula nivalis]|uniref:Uncharacterized protein n=1 Tax=Sulfuriferula nivalis TaxID=2675298 RepID=A0A809RHQ2_9PROT|nr:hypothetical protein [Sulfuriferula nivalis]BBP00374.1 hypothetical protein SFSGTM_10820 [Sulfuriferula nivalis]